MKKLLYILLVLVLIGVVTGLYMWNKPHTKVENAKGVAISADSLTSVFSANEAAANTQYLNKALVVSGVVAEVDKNQDGGIMVVLGTSDPMAAVQCTMREKGVVVNKGQKVTIKGFCSGNGITGVSITDCVLEQ